LDKAAQLEPEAGKTYYRRGNCHFKRGDLDKALRDYNKAVVNDPCLAEAYYERENVYRRKGDWNNAISNWNQTIQLKPNVATAYNNFAWLLATCPDSSIRNGNIAVELALKVCELSQWKKWNCVGTLAACRNIQELFE
jgi:tetratricopeptide (TPR) repeat protein